MVAPGCCSAAIAESVDALPVPRAASQRNETLRTLGEAAMLESKRHALKNARDTQDVKPQRA